MPTLGAYGPARERIAQYQPPIPSHAGTTSSFPDPSRSAFSAYPKGEVASPRPGMPPEPALNNGGSRGKWGAELAALPRADRVSGNPNVLSVGAHPYCDARPVVQA